MSAGGSDELVLMGRIGAAHGIRGEVRILSFTANPVDIAAYGPLATSRQGFTVTIGKVRPAGNMVIASLAGISDRTAAEKLNGVELFLPRSRLPEADGEDDFYHADLIGLAARTPDGMQLGEVIAVPNFGAGDLLEVRRPDGNTVFFAFTRQIVPEVNLGEGYLVVMPPAEVSGEPEDGEAP